MQVGQNLIEKISPALSDFGALGKETAAKYAQALRNSLQTVKEATGFEQPIEKLMTPQQMETLTNVGKDLARRSNMQELGRGVGSNTFQNMAMDNLISQSANPKMTGITLKTLDAILNKIPVANALSPTNLMKGENAALQQKLAEALLNPQEAARLMDLANKMPSAKGEMLKKLIQGGMLSVPAQNQGEQ
jgi:polyhydroxyalkanoate synthesis regulator phasin